MLTFDFYKTLKIATTEKTEPVFVSQYAIPASSSKG